MLDRPWLQVACLILLNDTDSNRVVNLLQRVVCLVLISLVESAAILSALSHAQPRNHHTVFNTVARAKLLLLIRHKATDLLIR